VAVFGRHHWNDDYNQSFCAKEGRAARGFGTGGDGP
jgi:hypothetical protein